MALLTRMFSQGASLVAQEKEMPIDIARSRQRIPASQAAPFHNS